MAATKESWQEIAQKAQQKVLDDIPAEWKISQKDLPDASRLNVMAFPEESGMFSKLELEITNSYATTIVAKLAHGEWTSEDVTRAFCKRAAIAHQLTNCLTVIMFDDAIKRAKELDASFKATGKVTGPFHGLPISIKDNFNIKGYPTSLGFCGWASDPADHDSTIISTLRRLGAVLYVKTNVPTAMMIAESVNNTYGRTVNPHNRATTSGGSSGGESALIAFRGSPLGVGTDIGGSLRIPAACTGIYTIRPSYGRFPNHGARSGLNGQESVGSVHGPLARSLGDLQLYAKHVVDTEPWLEDPKVVPIPWREIQLKPTLKLAVLWDNELLRPTPPVQRALRTVVEKLKAQGYEIVDWPVGDFAEALEIFGKFVTADGGQSLQEIVDTSGEPLRPELKAYDDAKPLSVYDLWQLQSRRTALQKRFLDRWASLGGVDAILGPTTPYAGAKNGTFRFVGYTSIFNVLDYSSSSFPTGLFVDKAIDGPIDTKIEESNLPNALKGAFGALGDLATQTQKEYDPETSHGVEISLQLTGRRLEEEKVLAMTERIVYDLQN